MACIGCYHAGMGRQARDVQYTVRGIPPEVDRALRRKAAHRKQSLNQVIVDELIAATRREAKSRFDDLVGKWAADPGFDEIISAQRNIDAGNWK